MTILSLALPGAAQVRPRAALPATVSPRLASAQDQGPVPADQILPRVVLWLAPSPAQQSALDLLLRQQRDPMSPEYHHWLSPEEFAARFGAPPATLRAVQDWGQAHGWNVVEVARGGNYVAFAAPAAAVESALGVALHRELADGQFHFANLNEPQLPPSLSGVVAAITGLNDFRPHAATVFRPRPLVQIQALSPAALAAAYDLNPLVQEGFTGSGQTLVVVGQSAIDPADLHNFRADFSIAGSDPTVTLVPGGSDPGITGDLNEADLDLEWAGAVAPAAAINYVYAPDAFDAVTYAVSQKLGSVVSISFGGCEALLPAAQSSALVATANQANAEGITLVAATGDSGAAACESRNSNNAYPAQASHGLAVNEPASLPQVTAVGGTEFDSLPGGGYPGEKTWNDTAQFGSLTATGGGISSLYPQPGWQSGPGVSSTPAFRNLPDIAFDASGGYDPYIIETGGSQHPVGGTSAATPVFAASLLLLEQYMQAQGIATAPGLGNINPNLYTLAQATSSVFHDITSGDNKVPCVAGTPNCPNGGTIGYAAGPGYDPVTGLGSLDLDQFAFWWTQFAGQPQVSVTPSALAFPGQVVGTASTLSLTVANAGNGLMPLGAASVTGAQAGDFTVTDPCPKFLLGGDQCTLTVTFKPAAGGAATASLSLAGSTTTLATVALSGSSAGPAVSLSPTELYFPDQQVGSSSSWSPVLVTNTGQSQLAISSVTLTGANPGDFQLGPGSCPASAMPGPACTPQVQFKPTAAGHRTATLTVTDDAPDSPQTIPLVGDAVDAVTASTSAINFGVQVQGRTSVAEVVTVTGHPALTMSGANPADFPMVSSGGAVTIWFVPAATGARSATLEIADPSLAAPLTVALAGTGAAASAAAPVLTLSNPLAPAVAGNGTTAPPTDNVLATLTSLGNVQALAADAAGNLYVGSFGNVGNCQFCGTVRKISASNHIITTIAGNASGAPALGDGGPAAKSGLYGVESLAVDPAGNIFINDDDAYLREISAATGVINTIVSNLGTTPLSLDAAGDVFFLRGCAVQEWNAKTKAVSTVAGDEACAATGPTPGPALGAQIRPYALAVDHAGNLFLASSPSDTVFEVSQGQITPALPALSSVENNWFGFDPSGSLVLAGSGGLIRAGDRVETVAVPGGIGPGAMDANGNISFLNANGIATLAATPAPLSFASAVVGTPSTTSTTLLLSNTGNAPLTISSITLAGANPGDFTLTAVDQWLGHGTPCSTIAPGADNCSVTLTFTPAAVGDRTATLVITTNADNSPRTLALTGTGLPAATSSPSFSAAPASLIFPPTPIGTVSAAQTVTITNSGAAAALALVSSPGDFPATGCGILLAPQQSCTLSVTFAPSVIGGQDNQRISVANGDFSGAAVTVSGEPEPSSSLVALSPAALSFAVAAIGDASPRQLVTVSNIGSAPLHLSNVAFAGANASDFKVTANTCLGSIAPGNGCTLGVVFNPGANGKMSASLALNSDAFNKTASVALTGATGAPTVALSPASLAFGNQAVGIAATATLTVANQGAGALALTAAAFSGPNAADFSQSNTCAAAPVAAQSTCTITVTFKPGALGSRSATLSLADNAPDAPQLIAVSGTGVPAAPQVSLSPDALSFAAQPTGTPSPAQTITLTNTGNAALDLASIALSGPDSGSFAQSNTCGATLAPAAHCAIAVTFTPSSTGGASATLLITDNAGDSPESAALSGTGVVATLTLAPASLTFAAQATASTSAAQSITVTNTGSAPAAISSIAASGDFGQTNTCGSSLAVGGTCTIAVTFAPTATGARNGTLTLTDSAPGSPQTAALAGTGADMTIAPGNGASTSSTVAAGQPATFPLSFTSVNGLAGTFTLVCTGAPAAATCTPAPAAITLGSTPATSTVTVTTTARSLVPPLPSAPPRWPWQLLFVWLWAAALLAASAVLSRNAFRAALLVPGDAAAGADQPEARGAAPSKGGASRRALRPRLRRACALASLAAVLALAAACGGGGGGASSSSNPPPSTPAGTPAGTYTLTLTATSGSGPATVTRTIPLTLVVQ